jgi:plasmid stabilization system protein ParE
MKINILRAARDDLYLGYLFYEACDAGIGSDFLDAMEAEIMSLSSFAGSHMVVSGYFRKLAKRFPYSIFYKVEGSEVRVYAVIDNRHDPDWINERLS